MEIRDYNDLTLHERMLIKINIRDTTKYLFNILGSNGISKNKKQAIIKILIPNYNDYVYLWSQYNRYGINKIKNLID